MPVGSTAEVLVLLLLKMTIMIMTSLGPVTSLRECSGDVTRYIARHVDVSYEVLANYDRNQPTSSTRRLRGRFNLTNTGTTTVRRGRWEIYLSSLRRMQLGDDNATLLGDSGLKAR